MGEINWALINSRLPYARTKEQYEERRKMWRAIDVNDNGFVSLAEITRVKPTTHKMDPCFFYFYSQFILAGGS